MRCGGSSPSGQANLFALGIVAVHLAFNQVTGVRFSQGEPSPPAPTTRTHLARRGLTFSDIDILLQMTSRVDEIPPEIIGTDQT